VQRYAGSNRLTKLSIENSEEPIFRCERSPPEFWRLVPPAKDDGYVRLQAVQAPMVVSSGVGPSLPDGTGVRRIAQTELSTQAKFEQGSR
jgi:hypothetical protein